MNCKLEKFWNDSGGDTNLSLSGWTVNLKSFEIFLALLYSYHLQLWTVNLKSFEMEQGLLCSLHHI